MSWRIVLLTLCGLWFAAPAGAQEKLHPITGFIRAELKDPSKPFTVLVTIAVKEGTAEKALAAFKKALPDSVKDKGCLDYSVYRDVEAPNRFLVHERWEDFKCLRAHIDSSHIVRLLDEMRDLMAARPDIRVLVAPAP